MVWFEQLMLGHGRGHGDIRVVERDNFNEFGERSHSLLGSMLVLNRIEASSMNVA